jgi:hypothetical protein
MSKIKGKTTTATKQDAATEKQLQFLKIIIHAGNHASNLGINHNLPKYMPRKRTKKFIGETIAQHLPEYHRIIPEIDAELIGMEADMN